MRRAAKCAASNCIRDALTRTLSKHTVCARSFSCKHWAAMTKTLSMRRWKMLSMCKPARTFKHNIKSCARVCEHASSLGSTRCHRLCVVVNRVWCHVLWPSRKLWHSAISRLQRGTSSLPKHMLCRCLTMLCTATFRRGAVWHLSCFWERATTPGRASQAATRQCGASRIRRTFCCCTH